MSIQEGIAMATTALDHLQEQIEAIRREAFAAGYAAAMQAIREFAAQPGPDAEAAEAAAVSPRRQGAMPPPSGGRQLRQRQLSEGAAAAAAAAAAPPRQMRRSMGPRPQRGTNARFVEEVLQSNAPRALRPAEIRSAIQRDKGVAMAFTSIRHALGQLEARHVAEQVADSKTWRYTAAGAAEAASE
jgi:hypothetical protein